MEENKVQFTREEEKEFVDFIFECMYENPVHAGVELANFSIHFDGSDDRADQAWFIDKITDYMSEGTIIPCVVTMSNMGLTISNINAAEYIDCYHPNVTTETVDTTMISEADESSPSLHMIPPVQQPADEEVDDKPTFDDLRTALFELFCDEPNMTIKRWGDYNVMKVPHDDTNVARYAFSKPDLANPNVHYLVFDDTKNETVLSNAFTTYDILNTADPIESLKKHEDISKEFVDCLIVALTKH